MGKQKLPRHLSESAPLTGMPARDGGTLYWLNLCDEHFVEAQKPAGSS
jgi:hypothetical protein